MSRKTRAHKTSFSSSAPSSVGTLFRSEKSRELDPANKANFEHQGRLTLLDIDYPPPTTLIREFYSYLSIHVYNFNTLVKSWI